VVRLIQVGAFAIKDVSIKLNSYSTTKWGDYMTGAVSGTMVIGPLIIVADVRFDGRPDAPMFIDVAVDVDIAEGIHISGGGRFVMPCQKMGDMRLNASILFTDVGMDWLAGIEAVGTYESDCKDQWKVEVTIDFSGDAPEVSEGVKISFGAKVKLLIMSTPIPEGSPADTKPDGMMLQLSFNLGDKVEVALGLVIADAGVKVSLGVHIQETTMADMFKQMDQIVPGSGVGEGEGDGAPAPAPGLGESKNSKKGSKGHATAHAATRAAVSARLGEEENADGLGEEVDAMVIPETHILFEFDSGTGGMTIFVAIHDVKIFNLGLDIVLVLELEEGEWKCFAYLGFTDIANGWLDFPQPWTWLSVIANIPLAFLTGGKGLQAFGIKFATEQMMISPIMVQYMPHPIPVVRRCSFTLVPCLWVT